MSDTRSDTRAAIRPAEAADDTARALHAVQVALDRRDNGGDAAAMPEPPAQQH